MDILSILQNGVSYIAANSTAIVAYLAAGGGISVALQVLKKMRKWERSAWIQFVLAVFSVATAAADYVINNYTTGPVPQIFGDMAPKILVAAMLMHRIAINPLSKLIEQQVQGMIKRAAVKAADNVSVTGSITPHITADPGNQDLL